jgi:hypothetical protein
MPDRLAPGQRVKMPTLERGRLRCEQCGALEHAGMLTCQRADCAYTLRRTRGGHPLGGILAMLVSVAMLGLLVVFMQAWLPEATPGDASPEPVQLSPGCLESCGS